jgi:transposase
MHTSIEKIRLVISYLFNHHSNREIAKIVVVSRETVAKIKALMTVSELKYEEFTQLGNSELEAKLKINRSFRCTKKIQPDTKYYCSELEKHKGLTKTVLWEEFIKETKGNGVCYTSFCNKLKDEQERKNISQIQLYHSGEVIQIDYSGDKFDIDLPNGEIIEANIFVGVLPYSGLLFNYATMAQKSEDWLKSCNMMFSKIGGLPHHIVCDNAKALITQNNGRIVKINPYFEEYLYFYNLSVLPARKYKPKDKAMGENGVNLAQKQILMRLRNEKFLSLEGFNERLEYMTDEYNRKITKTFPKGRKNIFDNHEMKELRPLPDVLFPIVNHHEFVIVPLNYHVKYLNNYYSVPHSYVRKKVELRVQDNHLFIRNDKDVIAQHSLLLGTDKISTLAEHKAKNHITRDHLTKDSILSWAECIGFNTLSYCNFVLSRGPNLHNNLSYLFELRDWVNDNNCIDRLELALDYAFKLKIQNLARLQSIIKNNSYLNTENNTSKKHKNLRGSDYYKGVEKC